MIETALYSFWSKPYRLDKYKNRGEFNNVNDFNISWKTSVKLSKKIFKNVILVTDKWSWENLFKHMNLPFTEVKIINDINIDTRLWSISKAYAIKEMNKPFLHIDSDVYIWKKLDDNYLNSDVLIQGEEGIKNKNQYLLYQSSYWDYINSFKGSNKYLDQFNPNNREIYAYNCGVIGGNDLTFLHDYADNMIEIFNIYDKKREKIEKLSVAFLEQTLILMMTEMNKINVDILIEENIKQDFYTHLAGSTKRNKEIMKYLKIKYDSIFSDQIKI